MKIVQIHPMLVPTMFIKDGEQRMGDFQFAVYGLTDEGKVVVYNYDINDWEDLKSSVERMRNTQQFLEDVNKRAKGENGKSTG